MIFLIDISACTDAKFHNIQISVLCSIVQGSLSIFVSDGEVIPLREKIPDLVLIRTFRRPMKGSLSVVGIPFLVWLRGLPTSQSRIQATRYPELLGITPNRPLRFSRHHCSGPLGPFGFRKGINPKVTESLIIRLICRVDGVQRAVKEAFVVCIVQLE